MTCKLYRHFSSDGKLLYIGIAIDALSRTYSHKDSHWANEISRIEIENFADKRSALRAEKKAIISEKPMHNILHNLSNFEDPKPPETPAKIVFELMEMGFTQKELAKIGRVSQMAISRLYRGLSRKLDVAAYNELLKVYRREKRKS